MATSRRLGEVRRFLLALCIACGANAAPDVENFLQFSADVYSGGEPVEETTFSALAAIGVRTVVSVDGAMPDVAAAERNGLRYVHIPMGYDGVQADVLGSLHAVLAEAKGRFYVHCHHGVHRGPAAAERFSAASRARSVQRALWHSCSELAPARTTAACGVMWANRTYQKRQAYCRCWYHKPKSSQSLLQWRQSIASSIG